MADDITYLRQLRDASEGLLLQALRRALRRQRMADGNEAHIERVSKLLEIAEPRHLTHDQLRTIRRHKLPFPRALSFRQIMTQRWDAKRLGVPDPVWLLDRKRVGQRFADDLGVRTPKVDPEAYAAAEVPWRTDMVVKPEHGTGARGVHLVLDTDRIIHVYDNAVLDSPEAMEAHLRRLMIDRLRPLPDRWTCEELIVEPSGEPARDLKFFSFYGEVMCVKEVVRLPKVLGRFWDADGRSFDTDEKPANVLPDGIGITDDQVKVAARISSEIPAPFARIDMYPSATGELVMGEFTPQPSLFELFRPETDRALGEAFVRAEGRLVQDLLDGKPFDAFKAATT